MLCPSAAMALNMTKADTGSNDSFLRATGRKVTDGIVHETTPLMHLGHALAGCNVAL